MGADGRLRWGDSADLEDEDVGLDNVLPPSQVFGPDEKGIKTIIDYRFNEEGQKVKVTKKVRVKKQVKKLSKTVIARRGWKKFGDAAGMKHGQDNLTAVSTEEIFLERYRPIGSKEEAKPADALGDLAKAGNASLLVCRICGKKGDHWTAQCPYKDLANKTGLSGSMPPTEDDGPPGAGSVSAPPKPGSYVPPSLRAGAKPDDRGADMRRRGDDNSIRVTNLSEDTREADLQELFRPFGAISRIYVAFDRQTNQSRGFAFINFVSREDAARAIAKLDGYGYDNLILRVEWATPREPK